MPSDNPLAHDAVAELTAKIEAAEAEIAASEKSFVAMLTDRAEAGAILKVQQKIAAVRADRDRLREQSRWLNQKLGEANAAEEAKRKAAETAQRWKEVEELLAERNGLVADVETTITKLAKAYGRISKLGEEAYELAPVKPSANDAPIYYAYSRLGTSRVEEALRIALYRAGFHWAVPNVGAGDISRRPTLAEVVAAGTQEILAGKG